MKKRFWVTLIALVMITLMMVSCVQNGPAAPAAPDAATFEATAGIGVVELNWGAVAGATFYNIVIDFVLAPGSERSAQTHWEYQVANPPYTWTVPYAGTFSWTVQAGNTAGTSAAVPGDNFTGTPPVVEPEYDDPVVEITDPAADNDVVNSLTPTITWTATPGELLESANRGDIIDSCDVVFTKGGVEVHSGDGVLVAGTAWDYDVPADVLDYGQTYTVEVTAHQGEDAATDERIFKTPAELELEISPTEAFGCATITATVTANNPDIDKVALFGKLVTSQDYSKLAPAGNDWRELDENHQAVFELNSADFAAGDWVINAQALGSAAKSQEKALEVKEASLTPALSVEVCGNELEGGEFICFDSTIGATAVYTVGVNFAEGAEEQFSDMLYTFVFAGSDTTVATGLFTQSATTDTIDIYMATECTKLATLTIDATTVCGATLTELTTFGFILDGAQPTATISEIAIDSATETAVIVFAATDTKSLCEATITLLIEKVDLEGVQMWDPVTFKVGDLTFGNENFGGEATYTPVVGPDGIGILATVTLDLPYLDGATITTAFEVIDYCEFFCCDQCGDAITRESVSVEGIPTFYDNRFYDAGIVNVSFYDSEDFAELGDAWLVMMDNNPASATVWIADAYPYIGYYTVDGATLTIESSSVDVGESTLITAPCTGYPTKTLVSYVFTVLLKEATEGVFTFTFIASDVSDNATELTQDIVVDTMPPTLTVVNGLKKYLGPGNDALQFSFRDEDADQGVVCLGATVTVIPDGSHLTGQREEYLPEYYASDCILQVSEDSKTWKIDPLTNNGALDADGTVRLEVLAKDKYGNQQVSTLEGEVIDYTPER